MIGCVVVVVAREAGTDAGAVSRRLLAELVPRTPFEYSVGSFAASGIKYEINVPCIRMERRKTIDLLVGGHVACFFLTALLEVVCMI